MRIIGGEASGRRIRAPHGQATRPTSDRVREAIFNILGAPGASARVLDLFAGAGGLGLEALSRGAATCVFVDRAVEAVRMIEDNAAALGWKGRVRVLRGEAIASLAKLAAQGQRFAWVFVDPPYAGDDAKKILSALGGERAELVDDDGVVIVEHDKRNVPDDDAGGLHRSDRRRYGDTEVSFYMRKKAA
jgi:16S rRNA (guanine(966)-N(2))-methyltransferase RsmD